MVGAPELLVASHSTSTFACGEPSLDSWLKQRALPNQTNRASRTYVVSERGVVVGYYALAVGSIVQAQAAGRIGRNMPEPIPVMLLARLAVDHRWQGRGLGADLLLDSIERTLSAADIAGIRAMVVDAISDGAAAFYEHWGFMRSPVLPMRLMATLDDLAASMP